jgi:hypothetical protein
VIFQKAFSGNREHLVLFLRLQFPLSEEEEEERSQMKIISNLSLKKIVCNRV